MRLGQRTRWWYERENGGWFEHREKILAIARCPVCGDEVALLAETDGWVEAGINSGRWRHESYGPAAAEHCGKIIADWWEGTFVFDLEDGR